MVYLTSKKRHQRPQFFLERTAFMSKILIVEDEQKIARFLELELKYEGYHVMIAGDGREGLEAFESSQPDLIILDLMLPKLSGIEVCRRIRQTSDVPIIMLTAKDDVSDKVMGLDMGADDYITKPFAIEELLARIRVGLKKHRSSLKEANHSHVLQSGPIKIDPSAYRAFCNEVPLNLTKKEFDLLYCLMKNQGKAMTRDELLNEVWGYSFMGETNIVDVYIRYLRQKIDDAFNIKSIQTIRAVGYMFHYEEDK